MRCPGPRPAGCSWPSDPRPLRQALCLGGFGTALAILFFLFQAPDWARVEDPSQLGEAWEEALGCGRPALLEVITDPEVPPLPPHIRLEQAKGLAQAMLKGEPATPQIARQTLREKFAELVHR
ncbi:MAG TPA: hypothetical protein VHI77_04890 [Solirubrobacterales bacterium]|nr:hypothetical protein [Solirubrobacterales bacterium]